MIRQAPNVLAVVLVTVWAYIGVSVKQAATPSVSLCALAIQTLIRRRAGEVTAG